MPQRGAAEHDQADGYEPGTSGQRGRVAPAAGDQPPGHRSEQAGQPAAGVQKTLGVSLRIRLQLAGEPG